MKLILLSMLLLWTSLYSDTTKRVYNGTTASIEDWKFYGSLGSTNNYNASRYYCGSTLIGLDVVITAAHCVKTWTENTTMAVSFNSSTVASMANPSELKKFPIKTFYKHPDYSFGNFDIAIIVLDLSNTNDEDKRWLSENKIEIINEELTTDMEGSFAGFGNTESLYSVGGYNDSKYLLEGTNMLYFGTVPSYCRNVNATEICLGGQSDTGTGAQSLSGDSGGPVVITRNGKKYIVGINSRIAKDVVTFLTDVKYFKSWIESKVSLTNYNDVSNDTSNDADNDTSNDADNDTSNDADNDTSNDADNDTSNDADNDTYNKVTTATNNLQLESFKNYITNLDTGWHLIGSDFLLDKNNIKYLADGSNILLIAKYNIIEDSWLYLTYEQIENDEFSTISSIEAYESFWIYRG